MIENILKKSYTLPILLVIIFGIYLINVMPVHSWTSSGVDHFDFLFAAKHHLVAHSTGFPTYMWLANLFLLMFPFAHPAWVLALTMSTIPMLVTIWVTFQITRILLQHNPHYLYLPYIAALTLAGAQVLLAQVFIVEVYSFSAMLIMLTLYFHIRKQYNITAVMLGLVTGAHGLVITMGFIFGLIYIKIYWKRLLIILPITLALYSYIPIMMANTPQEDITTLLGRDWKDYITYFKLGSSSYWWGNLLIQDLPSRLWSTVALITASIGLTSIGIFYFLKHELKTYWKFVAIISLTIYYWFGTAVPIVHVHLALAFPIIVILATLGLKYSTISPKIYLAATIPFILVTPFFWDIGRVIDKDQSAQKYYDFIDSLPPNQDIALDVTIVQNSEVDSLLTDGTAIWWGLLMLGRSTDKQVITILPARYTDNRHIVKETDQLVSTWYRENLSDRIKVPESTLKLIDNKWYAPLDDGLGDSIRYIEVPEYAYDPTCEVTICPDLNLEIDQFQLWWVADRLAVTNPDRKVSIAMQTGDKETVIDPIYYSRDLMDIIHKSAIEEIYTIGQINFEEKIRMVCRADNCIAGNPKLRIH